MTSLQLVILFSLLYAIVGFYIVTTVSTCIRSESNYVETDKIADFCTGVQQLTSFTPEETSITYVSFITAELLPFLFFFALNDPHDCFQCLGKDPERRYSVFQLTQRENMLREHMV